MFSLLSQKKLKKIEKKLIEEDLQLWRLKKKLKKEKVTLIKSLEMKHNFENINFSTEKARKEKESAERREAEG